MPRKSKRVYLDFAAASPLHPAALKAYVRALTLYGNASAPHAEGRAAREAVNDARRTIARTLLVKPEELVFTSGGTEANNIAILGSPKGHAVTTTIEHSSVTKSFEMRKDAGSPVTYVQPRPDGLIDADAFVREVTARTVLVSIHHVQSEAGTVQRVADIARAVKKKNPKTIVHVDAAQSPLWLDAGPHRLCADLVTYDAQKVMGPKGVGVLYRDFSVPLTPLSGGGTQERSMRPGTENVPAIVAAAVAFQEAERGRATRARKVAALRDELARRIQKECPEARIIGTMKRRVANNVFVAFPGVDGDYLSVLMDTHGVSVTPRSACLGSGGALSHTALELTGDPALARATLRFSLGPTTTKADCVAALDALAQVLATARI